MYVFSSVLLPFRWLLWLHEETYHCRRLGMGLVVGNRRPAPLAGGDDAESHVRNGWDGPGCPTDRNRSGTVQNHEGIYTGRQYG